MKTRSRENAAEAQIENEVSGSMKYQSKANALTSISEAKAE